MVSQFYRRFKNKRIFSKKQAQQLSFDRLKTKERLNFLSKMRKLWKRLYYSSFLKRIVYSQTSSDHKSYFDINLTSSPVNLNDFLLFNKYWNVYREIYVRNMPLWNFGSFDKDLLSLKCSWEHRTFDSFASITQSFKLNKGFFKFSFLISWLVTYSMRFHAGVYLFVFFIVCLVSVGVFFSFSTGFLDLYYYVTQHNWTYVSSNLNFYKNNELVYFSDELYGFIVWLTGFTFFPTGHGLWVVLGDLFYIDNSFLFFFKNVVSIFLYKYFFFIENLSLNVIDRLMRLPSLGGPIAFEHVIWSFIELVSYPLTYNLLIEIWFEDFHLFYTHPYFYTGFWKIIYDVVTYSVFFVNKIINMSKVVSALGSNGFSILVWYLSYPINLLKYSLYFFFKIGFEFLDFFYYMFFLDKLGIFIYSFFKKIYLFQLFNLSLTVISYIFDVFKISISILFQHFFGPGVSFPFLWMDYIWEYLMIWLQHLPSTNVIFFRRFGLIFYYNWYVYTPFVVNIFDTLVHTIWFYLPSILYLYTYTGIEFIINLIPFVFVDNHVWHFNVSEHIFFFSYFKEFIFIVLKPLWWLQSVSKGSSIVDIIQIPFSFSNRIWSGWVISSDFFFFFTINFSNLWLFNWIENFNLTNNGDITQDSYYIIAFKPYLDTVFYLYKFVWFSIFALSLHHVALNESISNFIATWSNFLFFKDEPYIIEWVLVYFWKTSEFFFSEERLVYVINESRNRFHLVYLYLWLFEFKYIKDFCFLYELENNLNYPVPDFFLDAYWFLLDSFDYFIDDFDFARQMDLNLYNNAYISILREFGYTLPDSRRRLGSLFNIYWYGLIEAGYIDYAKLPGLDFYDEFTLMFGGPLYFDLGLFLDIWGAWFYFYRMGWFVEEEEDDISIVLPAYRLTWGYDIDKPIEPFIDRILGDFLIYGPINIPFRKTFTVWRSLHPSIYWESVVASSLLAPTSNAMFFDSFEDFFRQIYLYYQKDFILYNLFFELVPFKGFFYFFFTKWRDFFLYGWGLPIGPIEVWYPLDIFVPHFDFFFILSYYALFVLNCWKLFLQALGTSDVTVFVFLYMMFFSETKIVSHLNLNLYFLFEFFYFFYYLALWVFDVFVFWLTSWFANPNSFFIKNSLYFIQFASEFAVYENYAQYLVDVAFHEMYNNLMWDEIIVFYSFVNAFVHVKEEQLDGIGFDIFDEYSLSFAGLLGFCNYFLDNIANEALKYDVLNVNYGGRFRFETNPGINVVGNWVISFFQDYFSSGYVFDSYKREESLYLYYIFNYIVELTLNTSYPEYSKFPYIFREFVFSSLFFELLQELKYYSFYGLNSSPYLQEPVFFKSLKNQSVFFKWYDSYSVRQIGLPGVWYSFDVILLVGSFLFFILFYAIIYMFLGIFWKRWDLWMSYILFLYPRLTTQLKFKYSRSTDFYLYKEEVADFMLEYGDFYFQSADYIYLPYRKFTHDSFLKKPTWFFKDDGFMDFNLNVFYKWDSFFNNTSGNIKETASSSNIQSKGFLFKEFPECVYSFRGLFFDSKDKKYFPQFNYLFKDKWLFEKDTMDVSVKYVRYWIYIMLAGFSIDYAFKLNKFWSFKWFFVSSDFFLKWFWNSDLLAGPVNFFDALFASFGFIFIALVIVVLFYLFVWFKHFLEEVWSPSFCVTVFNMVCYGCLLLNLVLSVRFWEQRQINFNFFKRIFSKKQNQLESHVTQSIVDIANIFHNQTLYGWGPLLEESICLNSLVEDNFFHKDLKIIMIDNHMRFNDVGLFNLLITNQFAREDYQSIVVFDVSSSDSSVNEITNAFLCYKELSRFFIGMNLEDVRMIQNTNFFRLLDIYINKNRQWVLSHDKQSDQLVPFSLENNLRTSSFTFIDNGILVKDKSQVYENTLIKKLIESKWGFMSVLTMSESGRFYNNDLLRKDIRKFLKVQKSQIGPKNEELDLAYLTKIPLLESYIPDPVFKPEWPIGEYAPDMSPYLKNQWRYSWSFFGTGNDENLVYRELLERSAEFQGDEQAWGFADIYDPYDMSEKVGPFFRQEFYDNMFEEKLKRLSFKETWINFDINSTSNVLHEDKDLSQFSDVRFFQATFLDKESSMLRSIQDYPVLEQLFARKETSVLEYDRDLVFDLSFNFGYDGLTDHDEQ